jgi:hypothetical protein
MRKMPTTEKTTVLEDLRMVHPACYVVIGIWLLVWVTMFVPAILDKNPNAPFIPIVLVLPGLLFCLYILMVFWVNADSRRRRMNAVQWTLLGAFIPYGIGFIIYMLSRKPMPQPCPACGESTVPSHAFCTSCGEKLSPHCPYCKEPVETKWRACAHCGKMLVE